MAHSRSWLAAAFLVVWAVGPVSAGAAKKAAVEFRASLDKPSYTLADPILLTFTLKNAGGPVWVNTRFYVNSRTVPPDDREVYLMVTAPSGKELDCIYSFPTGLPKTDYFKLLEAGAELSSEQPRNLRTFFKLEEIGTYTLTATYDNVFGAELGLDAAHGPFTSAPVQFTLTP